MTITLDLSSWMLPTAITVIAIALALGWPDDSTGYARGVQGIFFLVPALFASMLAWIAWGVLK